MSRSPSGMEPMASRCARMVISDAGMTSTKSGIFSMINCRSGRKFSSEKRCSGHQSSSRRTKGMVMTIGLAIMPRTKQTTIVR